MDTSRSRNFVFLDSSLIVPAYVFKFKTNIIDNRSCIWDRTTLVETSHLSSSDVDVTAVVTDALKSITTPSITTQVLETNSEISAILLASPSPRSSRPSAVKAQEQVRPSTTPEERKVQSEPSTSRHTSGQERFFPFNLRPPFEETIHMRS